MVMSEKLQAIVTCKVLLLSERSNLVAILPQLELPAKSPGSCQAKAHCNRPAPSKCYNSSNCHSPALSLSTMHEEMFAGQ